MSPFESWSLAIGLATVILMAIPLTFRLWPRKTTRSLVVLDRAGKPVDAILANGIEGRQRTDKFGEVPLPPGAGQDFRPDLREPATLGRIRIRRIERRGDTDYATVVR